MKINLYVLIAMSVMFFSNHAFAQETELSVQHEILTACTEEAEGLEGAEVKQYIEDCVADSNANLGDYVEELEQEVGLAPDQE